jgi:hypothetical protein
MTALDKIADGLNAKFQGKAVSFYDGAGKTRTGLCVQAFRVKGRVMVEIKCAETYFVLPDKIKA